MVNNLLSSNLTSNLTSNLSGLIDSSNTSEEEILISKIKVLQQKEKNAQIRLIYHEKLENQLCYYGESAIAGTMVPCCELTSQPTIPPDLPNISGVSAADLPDANAASKANSTYNSNMCSSNTEDVYFDFLNSYKSTNYPDGNNNKSVCESSCTSKDTECDAYLLDPNKPYNCIHYKFNNPQVVVNYNCGAKISESNGTFYGGIKDSVDIGSATDVSTSSTLESSSYKCQYEKEGGAMKTQTLIAEINNYAAERTILIKELMAIYNKKTKDVQSSKSSLDSEVTNTNRIENELTTARKIIQDKASKKGNTVRGTEINTYYSKMYQSRTELVMIVLYVCIPLIILLIAAKRSLIPRGIARICTAFVLAVGAFLIIRKMWDMWWRSNMNYDEYNWSFDPNASKPTVIQYDRDQITGMMNDIKNINISGELGKLSNDLGLECIGPSCCASGTVYSDNKGKCLPSKISDITTTGSTGTASSTGTALSTDVSSSIGTGKTGTTNITISEDDVLSQYSAATSNYNSKFIEGLKVDRF